MYNVAYCAYCSTAYRGLRKMFPKLRWTPLKNYYTIQILIKFETTEKIYGRKSNRMKSADVNQLMNLHHYNQLIIILYSLVFSLMWIPL